MCQSFVKSKEFASFICIENHCSCSVGISFHKHPLSEKNCPRNLPKPLQVIDFSLLLCSSDMFPKIICLLWLILIVVQGFNPVE